MAILNFQDNNKTCTRIRLQITFYNLKQTCTAHSSIFVVRKATLFWQVDGLTPLIMPNYILLYICTCIDLYDFTRTSYPHADAAYVMVDMVRCVWWGNDIVLSGKECFHKIICLCLTCTAHSSTDMHFCQNKKRCEKYRS